jgi:hypothetical protein
MRNKFDTLTLNENQIRDLLRHMKTRLLPEANVELEAPITMEEMEMAVRQGKNAKRQVTAESVMTSRKTNGRRYVTTSFKY